MSTIGDLLFKMNENMERNKDILLNSYKDAFKDLKEEIDIDIDENIEINNRNLLKSAFIFRIQY